LVGSLDEVGQSVSLLDGLVIWLVI